jgi:hypothetical protein
MQAELLRDTDELALRLRLTNLLGAADLQPSGVSPSAVLIVRRMPDPLPGSLMSDRRFGQVDVSWERAARHALDDLYRHAARPVRGQLSSGANAILFADEGEMLACLALDVSRGDAWARWWWQAAARALAVSSAEGLMKLLCRHARSVPAVLHQLAQWGQAAAVVNALSPPEAGTVLQAVSQAFGLPDLRLADGPLGDHYDRHEEAAGEGGLDTPLSGHDRKPQDQSGHADMHDQGLRTGTTPWENWLPSGSVPRDLVRERACLLAVGLVLHRQPSITYSRAFIRSLRRRWVQQGSQAASAPASERGQLKVNPVVRQGAREDAAKEGADYPAGVGAQPGGPASMGYSHSISDNGKAEGESDALDKALQQSGAATTPDGRERTPPREVAGRSEPAQAVTQDAAAGFADGVSTRLGGVLYLINLMQHLGLPGCFEEGWGLASQVGAWGTLEVLARALLGTAGEALTDDALWPALAALDDREPGPLPGEGFRGSDSFRLPPAWRAQVDRLGQGAWLWGTSDQRLCIWSSLGYMLLECRGPRGEAAAEKRTREKLQAYVDDGEAFTMAKTSADQAPVEELTGPLVRGLSPDLRRWLALTLPYVRLRLKQALTPADAQDVLLVSGRLYVTATHVDLVMRLDDVSLPVRLSGLDHNPGWLANFGRVVQYHFE